MRLTTLVAGLSLAFSAAAASASTMYVDDGVGNLGRVDTTTGAVSMIGNMGVVMTDIAFDPTGNLYGLTFDALYKIDATTGASTYLGQHGIAQGNALVFGNDGTLYAAGYATNGLYRLNTTNGASSVLGYSNYASGGDLAFNNGELYLASSSNTLVKMNLADVAGSTAVGAFGVPNVYGIASDADNNMFAVASNMIYKVDTLTGLASQGVAFAGGLNIAYGQAFLAEAGAPDPAPVPLPAGGLLLLSALGLSGLVRRRA